MLYRDNTFYKDLAAESVALIRGVLGSNQSLPRDTEEEEEEDTLSYMYMHTLSPEFAYVHMHN
jgi:hypothetical protein